MIIEYVNEESEANRIFKFYVMYELNSREYLKKPQKSKQLHFICFTSCHYHVYKLFKHFHFYMHNSYIQIYLLSFVIIIYIKLNEI